MVTMPDVGEGIASAAHVNGKARASRKKRQLSIIVPAYNEGKCIFGTIKEIEKVMGNLDYEIIVIDNNSKDNTKEEVLRAGKANDRVILVRELENGKGAALTTGFNSSNGNLVIAIDADLDLHPKQIPLLIDYMKKYDADVVVGSKRHPLSKIDYPRQRKALSNIYYLLIRMLFGLPIKDTQAGLKLFKWDVLNEILPRVLCKKYAFDLELLVNAHHRGFKIVEAPIELNFQRLSSRIKAKDVWHIFIDTLAIFYRLRILKYYDGVKK